MDTSDLAAKNSVFYDDLWLNSYLTKPERFNTWPLVSSLLPDSKMRLEVGPGLRPRLPVAGTHFIDASPPAIERLGARGGISRLGSIVELPFKDGEFDLVAAFDVVEHVEDDLRVFAELTRVLRENGRLIVSVPLHPKFWTVFDDYVGHARRYEPSALLQLLANHNLVVEKSAVFGMQPNNPSLLKYAVKGMTEHRTIATRCYNWLFLPLGIIFQKRLKFTEGLMDLANVYEVVLVCKRHSPTA